MGIFVPIFFAWYSSKGTLGLLNKKNVKILELENQRNIDKEKYENKLKKLNEKNKKLQENLEKEKKEIQNLILNKNQIELVKDNYEQQIKKEKQLNIQNEQQIQHLKNEINEMNHKFNKKMESNIKNIEQYKNQINEKENNIKLMTKEIEDHKNKGIEKDNKINQLSQLIENIKKKYKENEIKIKSKFEENNKKYKNLEEQNNILKKKLNEQNIISKDKDDKIKLYELKISELTENNDKIKKENVEINKNENNLNKEIKIIKEKYDLFIKEKMSKISKSLIKNTANSLSDIKKKYDKIMQQKEIALNTKIEELKTLIKISSTDIKFENGISFDNIKNMEIQNSKYDINIDEDDNILSKTQIFSNNNKINIDNFDQKNFNDSNHNNKDMNHNKHQEKNFNLVTPQGPNDFQKNNNQVNFIMNTPKGDETQIKIKNQNKENLDYSFDCTNAMYLTLYIYEGTNEVNQELIIKNNGTKTWPQNTKFETIEPSDFVIDGIILKQQKPDEQKSYFITIHNLGKYKAGEYQANLGFYIDENIYGDKLSIRIKIKEVNNDNDEIEANIEKINEFRETFSLSEEEYPNEKILTVLQENDFNFEQAFSSLFG